MARRRVSVVGDVLSGTENDVTEVAVVEPVVTSKPKSAKRHQSSIYLPFDVHERLREIAFHQRTTIHDLLMDGVNAVLEKYGAPERVNTK